MIRQFDQRLLKKNHATNMPTRILYYDTETKQQQDDYMTKHRMKIAWTCYNRKRSKKETPTDKWTFWNDTEQVNKYIDSLAHEKTNLYVFGHNIYFDLQSSDFFYYFTKWGWVLDFIYDKGLTYILKIHKDKKVITLLSTTNFYPVGLAKLGEIAGIPKLDVDFEEVSEEDLSIYCKRDVEIIKTTMESWFAFILSHDLGSFSLSRAGQSFRGYRHRFMHNRINLHDEDDIIEFERSAYMGGRVECFFIGECKRGPFVTYDINSMYSFVMRNNQFPTRLVDYIENPGLDKVRSILQRFLVVAEVELNTDEPAYAFRYQGQIIFPQGRFKTFLCTPGVDYALDRDHLISVKRLALYEKNSIFNEYVDYFYALKLKYRQEDNGIMENISKHMLNNLYGKFAQKAPMIDEEIEITFDGYYRQEIPDLVTGKVEIVTKLFNKLFIQYGEIPSKTSFAAIAAHITEYARLYLWDIIKGLGVNRVLYCDTDSIKLRKSDIGKIKHELSESILGALKLEDESERLTIYAPKDYATEKKEVIKGVPKNAVKVSDNEYHYDQFRKQSTHLRGQITRYFIVQPVKKVLKRDYRKGEVLKSGKVKPFVLSDGNRVL